MSAHTIAIPVGTRLYRIQRVTPEKVWRVWTAVANNNRNPSEWYGTYLRLHEDGSVYRVHVSEEGWEEEIKVKGEDHD